MRTVQDDVPGGRGGDVLHVLVLAPGFVDPRKFAFKKNLQGFVKVVRCVQPGERPVRFRSWRARRGSWAMRRVSAV